MVVAPLSNAAQNYWPVILAWTDLARTEMTKNLTDPHSDQFASCGCLVAALADLNRWHRAIESQPHYYRDGTFHQDECALHRGPSAQAIALLNNLGWACCMCVASRLAPLRRVL